MPLKKFFESTPYPPGERIARDSKDVKETKALKDEYTKGIHMSRARREGSHPDVCFRSKHWNYVLYQATLAGHFTGSEKTHRFQGLMLKDLTLSNEVDNIHCVFCLAEDEHFANESVILRCQCKAATRFLGCIPALKDGDGELVDNAEKA
ncbi:hypothetical protein PENFLA_c023G09264 [Penicillium flavigenum]|uniref:Uncharacterized protein n=1 Tax=Penicillium flavigenum TaxID=254877 RepID=A0A1V6SUP5_9EURO|nr:hypothetical protein PENFLA_c023G09264 [Penicillium flavigenum]